MLILLFIYINIISDKQRTKFDKVKFLNSMISKSYLKHEKENIYHFGNLNFLLAMWATELCHPRGPH